MVLLRPAEEPWGMIAISVVLSTCVTAFAGLYPTQNAEGRDTGAARCVCIIGHIGFASRSPVKNVHSERSVSHCIFRVNASGSHEPITAAEHRSAVPMRKLALTEQGRSMPCPSGRETAAVRAESNSRGIAAPAIGQAMDRAARRATLEATLPAIWKAADRAMMRATRTATQTATVRATGRATGGATGTATRRAIGIATGQAIPRATVTATGRTTSTTTARATRTATGTTAGGMAEGSLGKADQGTVKAEVSTRTGLMKAYLLAKLPAWAPKRSLPIPIPPYFRRKLGRGSGKSVGKRA
jgi:hypothetical protein